MLNPARTLLRCDTRTAPSTPPPSNETFRPTPNMSEWLVEVGVEGLTAAGVASGASVRLADCPYAPMVNNPLHATIVRLRTRLRIITPLIWFFVFGFAPGVVQT